MRRVPFILGFYDVASFLNKKGVLIVSKNIPSGFPMNDLESSR